MKGIRRQSLYLKLYGLRGNLLYHQITRMVLLTLWLARKKFPLLKITLVQQRMAQTGRDPCWQHFPLRTSQGCTRLVCPTHVCCGVGHKYGGRLLSQLKKRVKQDPVGIDLFGKSVNFYVLCTCKNKKCI